MGAAEESLKRLKKSICEENKLSEKTASLILSDLTSVLNSYFVFSENALKLIIALDKEGSYVVRAELVAERAKNISVL